MTTHNYRDMNWRRLGFVLFGSLFLVLAAISCRQANDSASINLLYNQNISLSDVFDKARIIQLEKTEESLIAQISQVVFYEEKFYVLDRKQQKIFCFDHNGKFISTISQQGHGPGEFVYVSAITIDDYNKNLIFLSPPTQQLLIFDLDGTFRKKISVKTETVMGLNKIFTLNDSIYLITSLTDYQLLLFNNKKEEVVKKAFPLPEFIPQLTPKFNTFQFAGKTFVNPSISREILEIKEINSNNYISFDYGELNNTEKQISRLQDAFRILPDINSIRRHELLRSEGYLNHYLIKVMESNRFLIQLVAIENSIKHVVVDKPLNETFVFDYFLENVAINMHFDIHQDKFLIAFETRHFRDEESTKKFFGPWFSYFNSDFLNEAFLTPKDRLFIQNHNPMTDNPYLVVYKFKE